MLQISIEESLAQAQQDRDTFAKAIHDAAVRAGIIGQDSDATGPQLISLLGDLVALATRTHPKNGYIRFSEQRPEIGQLIKVAAPLILSGRYNTWEEEWDGRERIGAATHWRPLRDTGPGENTSSD